MAKPKDNQVIQMMKKLANGQIEFLLSYPVRENIEIFDWELDLAQNEDFALWEMEMQK